MHNYFRCSLESKIFSSSFFPLFFFTNACKYIPLWRLRDSVSHGTPTFFFTLSFFTHYSNVCQTIDQVRLLNSRIVGILPNSTWFLTSSLFRILDLFFHSPFHLPRRSFTQVCHRFFLHDRLQFNSIFIVFSRWFDYIWRWYRITFNVIVNKTFFSFQMGHMW